VRGYERRHDRQPETRTAGGLPASGAGGVGSVEALEDAAGIVLCQPGTLVDHLEDGVLLLDRHPDRDRRLGRRVPQRVGDQVADDLAKPSLITGHDRRRSFLQPGSHQADRPTRRDGTSVGDRVGSQGQQVDGPVFQGALLVESGQQEEVIDE